MYVRYDSWYISLRPPQPISKFLDNGPTTANFPYFYMELNAFAAYSAGASFNTDKHTEF